MDRQDGQDERHKAVTAGSDVRGGQQKLEMDDAVAHVDVHPGGLWLPRGAFLCDGP